MLCPICPHQCNLEGEEAIGICGAYYEDQGAIKEKYPDSWTSISAVHIESIPFYHVYPGSRTLLLGSSGCNLDCAYCSNHYLAKAEPASIFMFNLTPEKVVEMVHKTSCHNIVFGINEPVVSMPSLLKLAAVAKAEGIDMGCLTNGYMTKETAESVSKNFSFINVSLKSMSDSFYQNYAGAPAAGPVLENIRYFAENNHLEITTPVVHNINDHEIEKMTDFIQSINPLIPWHVFRLLPEYKMKDSDHPSISKLNDTLNAAREKLSFIYFSNFIGTQWVSTLCQKCRKVVIERINFSGCGGKIVNYLLQNRSCPYCGSRVPMHGDRVNWNQLEGV